ncbi:calcium/proton exchanger [Aphanothece hegewaldii CCALA 016]|uniref:Ca(2+)/H(+) antiporter n=1 Tax=Aphanothece hegewaldii CCALA 016 TaxID=2107694 RepID=A0A2T1LVD0_9CHRO|nr:calcium/proton exchanger [Aphanothece hegewaldii]PSF35680.1 calcium/proton exchanger [Aphanothece hegewaldii CCALA 016]
MTISKKILLGMLIFVPLAIAAEWFKFPPALIFVFAALGIVPLAALIAEATEEIADVIGPTFGGLLNATFGNLTEMVVSIVALKSGLIEVVKASILGAIIANMLLGLGLATFLGGLKFKEQVFEPKIARLNASALLLALLVLLTPSAIQFTSVGLTGPAIQEFSYAASVFLLIFYIFNLIFSAQSPFNSDAAEIIEEVLEKEKKESHNKADTIKQVATLLGCTVVLVFISEILVGSLEETVKIFHLTELFTGVILLPLFGGFVEYLTCISSALKNQMELSVSVAIGSTLQIVLLVTPILVLIAPLFGQNLSLDFNLFGMFAAGATVIVTNSISSDGQSNWLEGLLLLILYAVLGVAFYLHP